MTQAISYKDAGVDILSMCAHLTQQTKWDQCVGDVLMELGGTIRILEFKRATNKSAKERAKARQLACALQDSSLAHLEAVSRQIHWYVETKDPDPHRDVRIIP